MTDLVGREGDLAALAGLLPGTRLVTVIGPGGVGKTRLALAVASELVATCSDGPLLVDLAPVADLAGLWAGLATTLGAEGEKVPDLTENVVAQLRSREVLLVLDNCEHLRSACASLVSSVVRSCPSVCILATSRQPLGVAGERLWPLAGLETDTGSRANGHTPVPPPAVRLFVERAVALRPDFAVDLDEPLVVAELCRRLDGLPLAIEMAAAHVRVLSPAEILARLDDRFTLLRGGSSSVAPRQRSLEATLEWSHELLSDAEAILFRRLAVFAGSFTLAAAEGVCATPPLEGEGVLEMLASLVAQSLVVADTGGGETRYRLLETTQQYAAGRLASAETVGSMRERHATWFLALAEEIAPNLHGPMRRPWFARLVADHDNLQAALEWTMHSGRTDWALRIAAVMATFWRRRRLFDAGRTWLTDALQLPEQPAPARLEALLGLGWLVSESGDPAGAVTPLKEALRLAEGCGDAGAEARALNLLGHARLVLDVPATALPPLERSTERAREVGDRRTVLEALWSAGQVAMFSGDASLAKARFRACVAAAEDGEHGWSQTWPPVVGLGWAALAQGDHAEAEARLVEALATADEAGCPEAQAVVWCFQGLLARARGDYERARTLLGESLARAREAANSFAIANRLAFLGNVAHDRGDLDGAETALVEALAVARAADRPYALAHCLVALGGLRVSQGQPDDAASLLAEGEAVARAHGLRHAISTALLEQARLRRRAGDCEQAARAAIQAVQLQEALGDAPGLVDSLEELGGARATQGQCRTACRLFAAASAARDRQGIVRPPIRTIDYDLDVALARGGLTPQGWDAVWAAGASLSMSGAAAAAVKCRGRRDSPSVGWEAITPTERQVVALVARGMTNREAAATLVISSRTVETHVAHVLAKVGIASRRELARVASAKGFR